MRSTRPGAADPTRSKAANPPPRLRTEVTKVSICPSARLSVSPSLRLCVGPSVGLSVSPSPCVHNTKNIHKSNNKRFKNPSQKMVQNRCQNAPKSRSGGGLGASKCFKIEVWRGAARLLGASWAILASEVRPGMRLRANLGTFWSRHGAVLGRLWRAFGGVWRRLGVSLASL